MIGTVARPIAIGVAELLQPEAVRAGAAPLQLLIGEVQPERRDHRREIMMKKVSTREKTTAFVQVHSKVLRKPSARCFRWARRAFVLANRGASTTCDLAHAGIVSMGGAIIAMCRLAGTDAAALVNPFTN